MAKSDVPQKTRDLFNAMLINAAPTLARADGIKESASMVKAIADAACKATVSDVLENEYAFISKSEAEFQAKKRGDSDE